MQGANAVQVCIQNDNGSPKSRTRLGGGFWILHYETFHYEGFCGMCFWPDQNVEGHLRCNDVNNDGSE